MHPNATVNTDVQSRLESDRNQQVPVTAGTRVHVEQWVMDGLQGLVGHCRLPDGRLVLIARGDLQEDEDHSGFVERRRA